MHKIEHITKDWKEAGSFAAQINLYGFWDEHSFLTKSGDLGSVLKIGGIDYESLDHAGLDYAVKRLEAALRSVDDKCRLYQILFKRNRPLIPHAEYDNPLVRAAVEQRNLCVAACPTGAIAKDGHFDFGSCMTHNYREKVGNFVQWVHTIADSRNRHDYRRRVSDAETLSWWQSLGYEANTHCDYCVAVCPAGDEAATFIKDRKTHFRGIVQPLRERQEAVYVVPGSDAETYVVTAFPEKSVRRIGSGRVPSSIKGMVTMLPLLFQRGQSKGLAARYHLRFRGKEALEVTVDIRDQHIKVDRGLLGKADMTVATTGDSWLRFLAKDCNLYWEILRGHIRFRGSLQLLNAFRKCFPL